MVQPHHLGFRFVDLESYLLTDVVESVRFVLHVAYLIGGPRYKSLS